MMINLTLTTRAGWSSFSREANVCGSSVLQHLKDDWRRRYQRRRFLSCSSHCIIR
jgi:hypothetical protein